MSLVYLVQGLSDMAWLAEKYFLKDDLGASPAQVSLFLSLASVPWMVKPLLGFISDSLPLWGYRRRSYLLLASAAAAGSWVYLAAGATSLSATLWAMVLGSGAVALSDVVVDSIVVEKAREEEQDSAGNLQSLCWAAYAVGQVATAALSGSLVESRGPRFVFALTAAFPLLIGAASLMVHEERVSTEAALRGLTASIEETWSSDDDEGAEGGAEGWELGPGAAGGWGQPAGPPGIAVAAPLPVMAAAVQAEAEAGARASSSGRNGAAADAAAGGSVDVNGAGAGAAGAAGGSANGQGYSGAAVAAQAAAPLQPEPGGIVAAVTPPDPEVAAAAAARARLAAAALFASPPSLPPPQQPLPTAAPLGADDWGPPAAPLPGSPCLGGLSPPAATAQPFALLPAVSSATSSSSSSSSSSISGGGGLALSLLPPPVPAPIPCPTTAALHTTPASPRGRHRRPGGSRTHKPLPPPSALAAATALVSRPHPPSLRERGAALAAAAAEARSSMLSHGAALWAALSAPAIAWPVTFLMLLSATPAADDAVFFFEVEALGFTPSFLGAVQLAIAVASLGGVWLYNAAFKAVPLRSFLLWGNLLGAALQCSDLLLVARVNTLFGLDDRIFVLGGSVVTSVITNVLSMPTLVLAARLCPKGLEATMFATIMSLLNMADGVRYAGGAGLMAALGVSSGAYDNLPLLVGICNAALLLPLPVLALVPANLDCAELAAAVASSSGSSSSAGSSMDAGAGRKGAAGLGWGGGREDDECELSGLEEEAGVVPVPVPVPVPVVAAPVMAAVVAASAASAASVAAPPPAPAAAVSAAAAAAAAIAATGSLASADSIATPGGVAAADAAAAVAAAAPGATQPGTVSGSGRSRSPTSARQPQPQPQKPQPHLHPHSHFGDPNQHQPLSEQTWRQGWDPNWPPQPPPQEQQQQQDGAINGGSSTGAVAAAELNGLEPAVPLAAAAAAAAAGPQDGGTSGNGGNGAGGGGSEAASGTSGNGGAARPNGRPHAAGAASDAAAVAGGGEEEEAAAAAASRVVARGP
ncbi:hypothetical protein HYH02_015102 [Chlamydomonas schloesseri]|uniref:Folate/biopterin transporter n=1 Tax=Chlamydomonas schloesseri TaxID=2026947 RepID=A0A835SD99_9CHLO|nr:hypothetical protein HYH02_015102 [Chlamydomonas schloesseri]|eukprot:KAG2424839.1 hypothetical protein HYH02_015102 [Chlamydomonas schloesseri]